MRPTQLLQPRSTQRQPHTHTVTGGQQPRIPLTQQYTSGSGAAPPSHTQLHESPFFRHTHSQPQQLSQLSQQPQSQQSAMRGAGSGNSWYPSTGASNLSASGGVARTPAAPVHPARDTGMDRGQATAAPGAPSDHTSMSGSASRGRATPQSHMMPHQQQSQRTTGQSGGPSLFTTPRKPQQQLQSQTSLPQPAPHTAAFSINMYGTHSQQTTDKVGVMPNSLPGYSQRVAPPALSRQSSAATVASASRWPPKPPPARIPPQQSALRPSGAGVPARSQQAAQTSGGANSVGSQLQRLPPQKPTAPASTLPREFRGWHIDSQSGEMTYTAPVKTLPASTDSSDAGVIATNPDSEPPYLTAQLDYARTRYGSLCDMLTDAEERDKRPGQLESFAYDSRTDNALWHWEVPTNRLRPGTHFGVTHSLTLPTSAQWGSFTCPPLKVSAKVAAATAAQWPSTRLLSPEHERQLLTDFIEQMRTPSSQPLETARLLTLDTLSERLREEVRAHWQAAEVAEEHQHQDQQRQQSQRASADVCAFLCPPQPLDAALSKSFDDKHSVNPQHWGQKRIRSRQLQQMAIARTADPLWRHSNTGMIRDRSVPARALQQDATTTWMRNYR